MVMAVGANRQSLALAVEYDYTLAPGNTCADPSDSEIRVFLQFLNPRPIAPPGAKEQFIILAAAQCIAQSFSSGQRAVSRR